MMIDSTRTHKRRLKLNSQVNGFLDSCRVCGLQILRKGQSRPRICLLCEKKSSNPINDFCKDCNEPIVRNNVRKARICQKCKKCREKMKQAGICGSISGFTHNAIPVSLSQNKRTYSAAAPVRFMDSESLLRLAIHIQQSNDQPQPNTESSSHPQSSFSFIPTHPSLIPNSESNKNPDQEQNHLKHSVTKVKQERSADDDNFTEMHQASIKNSSKQIGGVQKIRTDRFATPEDIYNFLIRRQLNNTASSPSSSSSSSHHDKIDQSTGVQRKDSSNSNGHTDLHGYNSNSHEKNLMNNIISCKSEYYDSNVNSIGVLSLSPSRQIQSFISQPLTNSILIPQVNPFEIIREGPISPLPNDAAVKREGSAMRCSPIRSSAPHPSPFLSLYSSTSTAQPSQSTILSESKNSTFELLSPSFSNKPSVNSKQLSSSPTKGHLFSGEEQQVAKISSQRIEEEDGRRREKVQGEIDGTEKERKMGGEDDCPNSLSTYTPRKPSLYSSPVLSSSPVSTPLYASQGESQSPLSQTNMSQHSTPQTMSDDNEIDEDDEEEESRDELYKRYFPLPLNDEYPGLASLIPVFPQYCHVQPAYFSTMEGITRIETETNTTTTTSATTTTTNNNNSETCNSMMCTGQDYRTQYDIYNNNYSHTIVPNNVIVDTVNNNSNISYSNGYDQHTIDGTNGCGDNSIDRSNSNNGNGSGNGVNNVKNENSGSRSQQTVGFFQQEVGNFLNNHQITTNLGSNFTIVDTQMFDDSEEGRRKKENFKSRDQSGTASSFEAEFVGGCPDLAINSIVSPQKLKLTQNSEDLRSCWVSTGCENLTPLSPNAYSDPPARHFLDEENIKHHVAIPCDELKHPTINADDLGIDVVEATALIYSACVLNA